jgi:predicted transcriptional regulator
MVRITIRTPDELHEKLRWLAFAERRSQHSIILEVLEKALRDVKVPKEAK